MDKSWCMNPRVGETATPGVGKKYESFTSSSSPEVRLMAYITPPPPPTNPCPMRRHASTRMFFFVPQSFVAGDTLQSSLTGTSAIFAST